MIKNKKLFILIILPLFLSLNFTWSYQEKNKSGNYSSNMEDGQKLGTLSVFVVDKNQNLLPQIVISVLIDNKLIQYQYTDNKGKATFQLYPYAYYAIKVTDPLNQYASSQIDNIEIKAGRETSLTVKLNLLVNQSSFQPIPLTQLTTTTELTITIQPTTTQIEQIEIKPQPTISEQQFVTSTLNIFVKDENNNPLKNIEIRYNADVSNSIQTIANSQISDENGKTSFILTEGKYKIYAFDLNDQYILEDGSKELYIKAGQIINLEIKLKKKPKEVTKIKIKGKVLINNQPVKESEIYLRSDKEDDLKIITDEQGNFIFEILPNQKFSLQAQKVFDNFMYIKQIQEKEVGEKDFSLNINLEKLTDKPLPKETKVSFTPQEKKEIVLEDKTKIEVPESVVSQVQNLTINLKPTIEMPLQKNVSLLSNVYEVQIFNENNQEIKNLDKEIKIEIPYSEELLK